MLHSSDVVTAIAASWGVTLTPEQRMGATIRINELLSDAARGAEREACSCFGDTCLKCKLGVLKAIRTRESIDHRWEIAHRGQHARRGGLRG